MGAMNRDEFTERTIVLKVGLFREADCWVRILSPSRGIFTAFAFGGTKSRRRFPACLDTLNHVLFSIAMNRKGSYYYLREGSLLHRFPRIHRDMARLGMAVNCAKFVESVQIGPDNAQRVYEIVFRALEVLNEASFVPESFPLCFRASLAQEHGYGPDLKHCSRCGRAIGEDEQAVFFLRRGELECSACQQDWSGGRLLGGQSLAALDSVLLGQPEDWIACPFDGFEGKRVLQILDLFVQYHLGLVWERGGFRQI